VIAALEPLTTDARGDRLKSILGERTGSVTVVFDHPHDPHNGSAVLRSCDAFGVQRVHVICGQDQFAASRMVAKGSERWVDIIHHESAAVAARLLRQEGFRLFVTHPEGRLTPTDLVSLEKVAFILGNERDGVSQELTELADDTVRIPMRGFVESLNVSVTAAILVQAACQGRPSDLSERERQNIYARWLRKSVPRADEVLGALKPC
jgi:tRNA (guanosine-2'-O-)-methyltransferase